MKPPGTSMRTLDRLKRSNLAGRLLSDIGRILPPDTAMFHEAILQAGVPGIGQPLRYLPYNRQIHEDGDRTTALSLVVLFNNAAMERFFLKGLRKKLSRLAFRFTFNAMDRFIYAVRLDWKLLQIMAAADGEFSILGIVQRDEIRRKPILVQRCRFIFPLLLVPAEDRASHDHILRFEQQQTLSKMKIPLLPIYRNASHLLE